MSSHCLKEHHVLYYWGILPALQHIINYLKRIFFPLTLQILSIFLWNYLFSLCTSLSIRTYTKTYSCKYIHKDICLNIYYYDDVKIKWCIFDKIKIFFILYCQIKWYILLLNLYIHTKSLWNSSYALLFLILLLLQNEAWLFFLYRFSEMNTYLKRKISVLHIIILGPREQHL